MILRKIIREIVEAVETEHSVERELQRLSVDEFTVGYETQKGQYQKVGTYNLPTETKYSMKINMDKLKTINFPERARFGVLLLKAQINPGLVNYFSSELKSESTGKKLIFVGIGETSTREGTNGDLLYAIIENDFINTLFWKKSYLPKETIKHQLSVDRIFDNIDSISFSEKKQTPDQPAKQENIIVFDGVKWVVDKDKNILYKKNNPQAQISIEKAFEIMPEDIQEKILNFL